MEQNRNRITPEAATDEPASPLHDQHADATPAPGESPAFADPPLLSDSLDEALGSTIADSFPPGARKPRHDGWTPEAVAGFLRQLAATGVVEHAARAVGLSAASAYAFRNRRQGRAFASMWDAVLIHRTRARIASELQARAIAGCVSVRKRDGVVVGEYHYYDNRLAMALLTRLDRLAEREAADEAHLRALSEDLDDYIDCIAAGGDADAFVEERRPAELEPEPAPREPDDDPELTRYARMAGCVDYRDVDPRDIDVTDLDPVAASEWNSDQWVRAWRSGFMLWLDLARRDPDWDDGPGAPLQFMFSREAACAAAERMGDAEPEADPEAIDTSDLDPGSIWDWSEDQLARAWRSGFLERLQPGFWDDLAEELALPETVH